MVSVTTEDLPPPVGRADPAFRRILLALFALGFSTFSILYCVQPVLPVFSQVFHRSPAEASLCLSAATLVLGFAVLFAGVFADRAARRTVMTVSLTLASVLTFAVAFAPNWPSLLVARALTGLALSGAPAIAITYVAEEVDAASVGLAVGLNIAGNTVGGVAGRLFMGLLVDHMGWRAAVAIVAVTGLISAAVLALSLPHSRRFRPVKRPLAGALAGLFRPLADRGLPWLFIEAFLFMGSMVAVYNYIGFRLLAAPYSLSQTKVGLIFSLYLLGVVTSTVVGDLAGKLGRRKVFWAPVLLMGAGIALTTLHPLVLVVAGVAVLTVGFFGAYSVSASWVGRRGGEARAQATSLYLFAYYMGSSVVGSLSGLAWSAFGWNGVATVVGVLLAVAFAVSVGLAFLEPLPGNQPAAAA